jgi:putative aldouronate transport system substrate-binding protein
MKKETLRNIISLMIVTMMLLAFTACSGSKTDKTNSIDPEVRDFKIFAGISSLSPDNNEKPVIKEMNEKMDVNISWNCVSGDTLTERKNLILNAGTDMPDAFMGAALSDYEIITNGTNGIFIPLEDYINEETMPNLTNLIKQRPELLATCTMPDGHIYTLPTIREMGFDYNDSQFSIFSIPQFSSINTAWLDKLDLEMPTTIDELHDVLVAFKENDCNGNGDPNDEIPLSFEWNHWCANVTSLFSGFGFTDYNADHRAIKDGKVYYQDASENYKEAIATLHQWYKEGLIDIEAFSQSDSQYIAKGSNTDARLGVFSWWEIAEVTGEHSEDYDYLTYLSGKDGKLGVNLNEQGTTSHDSFAITSSCKNPELLLKWIDQSYDPIFSMQIIYGPIGIYFENQPDENGVYVETAEAGGSLKAKSELYGPSRQLSEDYGTYYYLEERAQQRLDDLRDTWFKNVDNFEIYPSVVYTLDETETINEYLSDITDYTSEKAASWIVNGGIEEDWDNYVAQLNKMGLQDVVAAWQSAYDRYDGARKNK